MRIDVKKYLFFGNAKTKNAFFVEAQKYGIVHFIDKKSALSKPFSSQIQNVLHALKILHGFPSCDQENVLPEEASHVVKKIIHDKKRLEECLEKERLLQLEMARIVPLGNYSKNDLEWIEKHGNRKIQFYYAKQGFLKELPENVLFLKTEQFFDYFLALNHKPQQYPGLIELIPEGSLEELQKKQTLLLTEINAFKENLKKTGKFRNALQQALTEMLNQDQLYAAQSMSDLEMNDKLFVVEGWVPVDKVNLLHEMADASRIHTEEILIEEKDQPPTCLENKGVARIGEDLVHIYDTPSVNDKDPSMWVLLFFALFFSMIIGDAGYGLVLLVAALYVRMKSDKSSAEGLRTFKLIAILGSSCIVWGVLSTSFFGIVFSPDSSMRKISPISWLCEKKAAYHFQLNDDVASFWQGKFPALAELANPQRIFMEAVAIDPKTRAISYELFIAFSNDILLELALFIGAFHISLSLLRYLKQKPSGLGWLCFIIGCYLYFPFFLEATSFVHYLFGADKQKSAELGLWFIFGGTGLAVAIGVIRDKLFGLLELMNLIQIFGDAMSYLRLYALALSGALVTSALMDLAQGLPFILSAILLIIGHVINLGLCVMGGVIHGLRLNFLEWYHYSFEGGGKRFNPLKKIN